MMRWAANMKRNTCKMGGCAQALDFIGSFRVGMVRVWTIRVGMVRVGTSRDG